MARTKPNSNEVINWICKAGIVYFVGSAIAGAIKRKREQNPQGAQGVSGIGSGEDDYMIIRLTGNPTNYGVTLWDVETFCGWSRSDGEKWARWNNTRSRWLEWDYKTFKTRKGAEKALQELIDLGEGKPQYEGQEIEFEIMTWREYARKY